MKKSAILVLCLALAWLAGCDGGSSSSSSSSTSTTTSSTSSTSSSGITYPDNWPLTGSLDVHDPGIVKEGNTWYVFGTGTGIQMKRSYDGLAWSNIGRVFNSYPSWANTYVPNHESNIWAPDIHYYNDKYYLYYSISSFGSNTSAIGLATTASLSSPSWRDQGLVIRSTSSNNYNCIDPNMVVDQSGRVWLAFGSFWSGLKLVELDPSTMKPRSGATIHSLATRNSTAIEAPYIVYRNGYYYLFASIDTCCQGVNSTYKIIYGRSRNITGTYYDKNGVSMMNGGGTLFDAGNERWRGPGGQSLWGTDVIAHHAYDASNNGAATLMIKNVHWDADGWPRRGDDTSSSSSSSTSSTSTSSTGGCN